MFFRVLLMIGLSIFILSCGGGSDNGSTSVEDDTISDIKSLYSFENLELYSFNTKFTNSILRYEVDEISSDKSIHKYFDEDIYMLDNSNQQIMIDSSIRGASNEIQYRLSKSGDAVASYNSKNIFAVYLMKRDDFKSNRLDEYNKNIDLKGVKYSAIKEYFVNLYKIEDLASNDYFEDLSEFITAYRSDTFIGAVYQGLIFYQDNQLLELRDEKYSDAGTFEIKKIDNQDVLFVYPTDLVNYPSNLCYILDFNRVWKSSCHLKDDKEDMNLYNESIYNSVLNYLQNNFAEVDVSI